MIRRATPADAEALSHLSRTCFTQTFGHLYAPSDLDDFLDEAYSPTVLRAELNDPERATWLLFDEPVDEAGATLSSDDLPGTPEPRDEAPTSSISQAPIGYVTASTSCRDTRAGAAGPRCCAPRWTGSSATDRARSGSACGAKTTGRSGFMRATASRLSATTPSWWATTPTTNSSRAASREGSLRE